MKKIITIALVLVVSISMVFAADAFDDFKADLKKNEDKGFAESLEGYKPSNPQSMGMGGAGLAINDSLDSLFSNPSILGQGKVRFSIPSVTITVNHVYDLLKKGEDGKSSLDKVQTATKEGITDNISELVPVISSLIGTGKSKIASAEASVGMIANVFGLAMNVNDTVRSFDGTVFDDLKISAVMGLGFGFGSEDVRFNIGFSGKLNVNAFSKRISVSDAISFNEDTINQLPFAIGYGFPFDAGLTFKYHSLKATATLTDIDLFGLGEYKYDMILVEDVTKKLNTIDAISGEATKIRENSVYQFTPKMKLNAGIAFDTESSTGIKLALDVVDILSIPDALDAGYSTKGVILGHTKIGAEFSLFNFLKVRGGLNSGYFTLGGTVNLGFITIDAAYFWEELGVVAGEKGLDGLSIRFNIGWDN